MKERVRRIADGILRTDFYQLTMGQLYFRNGFHERQVQFDYFFRSYPDYGAHQAGYCINAGLEWLVEWMRDVSFGDEEIEVLRNCRSAGGEALFEVDYLEWLRRNGDFSGISLQAIPEGRVVHPVTPLAVVRGPLLMAQILESPLLNQLNYQTLIATRGARMHDVSGGNLTMEFGLRRGQDRGAAAGTRAALIGGIDFTSNTGISAMLGFPPKGTHAHSMVQLYLGMGMTELDAFRAYADIYPDDCLLLVDTLDTLGSGVPNAIRVFEELRRRGRKPVGVRLDSGDLAFLAIQTARMLDDAGFPEVSIVLSNKLDERVITQILEQITEESSPYGVDPGALASRLVYGIGTSLIVSGGAAALDGVYKMSAVRHDGEWRPAIKFSETAEKTIDPGPKRVWRIYDRRNKATADLMTVEDEQPGEAEALMLRHPTEESKSRIIRREEISGIEPLLVDILSEGRVVYDFPSISDMRAVRERDMARLDAGVKRLVNPHIYHVSLSDKLWKLKQELIREYRRDSPESSPEGGRDAGTS